MSLMVGGLLPDLRISRPIEPGRVVTPLSEIIARIQKRKQDLVISVSELARRSGNRTELGSSGKASSRIRVYEGLSSKRRWVTV